jgi:hypothetical protein
MIASRLLWPDVNHRTKGDQMLVTAKLRRRTKAAARTAPKALRYLVINGRLAVLIADGRLVRTGDFLARIGGSDLPDGKQSWFGRHVAKAYRTATGRDPLRVWAQHRTTGKWIEVNVYGAIEDALYAGLFAYKGTRHLLTTEVA